MPRRKENMELKFEIDLDSFAKEMQAYAEEKLKYELRGKILSAITDVKCQLDWKGNFAYVYGRDNGNSVEKADVGRIIYDWVNTEFREKILEHFLNPIDVKEFAESLKKDDEFIGIIADRILRKRKLVDSVEEKVKEIKDGD